MDRQCVLESAKLILNNRLVKKDHAFTMLSETNMAALHLEINMNVGRQFLRVIYFAFTTYAGKQK